MSARARTGLSLVALVGAAALACDDAPRVSADVDAPDASDGYDATETADTSLEVSIPADHPCPELAVAPARSQLWADGLIVPIALRLPTPPGLAVRVTQGNNGSFSHFGDERYAWDFAVELGTPVHAAAGGVVVWVEDSRTSFGTGPEFRGEANFAVLDHGAGLFTSYVHLEYGSALVAPGDVVEAGDVLATTGLSGQMTGPHLHFQVENVWSESLPARFATTSGCRLMPQQDEYVTAVEVPLAALEATSRMPADAFAEDGVVELEGLPARLFERAERPWVRGRATLEGAVEVWFLVLPAQGGTAVFAQRFGLVAGELAGELDLSEVEPGQYGVVMVAGDGGRVTVPRSVRAAIIE